MYSCELAFRSRFVLNFTEQTCSVLSLSAANRFRPADLAPIRGNYRTPPCIKFLTVETHPWCRTVESFPPNKFTTCDAVRQLVIHQICDYYTLKLFRSRQGLDLTSKIYGQWRAPIVFDWCDRFICLRIFCELPEAVAFLRNYPSCENY